MLKKLFKNMWVMHSVRTAVAAGLSLYAAKLLNLSEFYWAPISTIVVMQSTLGASWDTSKQRFIGTVLGFLFAGVFADVFNMQVLLFALGIFALGIICAVLKLTMSAYRFAGITFAIILLMHHSEKAWRIGLHRFIEVALGIAVGLLVSYVGPDCPLGKAIYKKIDKNGGKA